MRREWIIKKGGDFIILFFGGWGMDENAIGHLTGASDVLMFYDYRDLSGESAPLLDEYKEIHVVAWSMGVWAASVLLHDWGVKPTCCIAINGTERPVDEQHGTHPKIYVLTEKGMTEQGRDKFFSRMLVGKENNMRFEVNKPRRALQEQVDELRCIREQSGLIKPEMHWDKVYISGEDVIFPVENQRKWWEKCSKVIGLTGGHYPFYVLDSWESVLNYGDK